MAFSKLAEEHHFGSLQFSSTHTYMNSPTDRITVVSANDDDVEYFDLSFPESGGKSGNYFRRVVKIRIPVAKTHVFWNGAGSPKYEFVVKTDSKFAQYLVKQEDGSFAPVTHPDFPDKDQAWITRGYLKDETFIDEGVFVLGETTMPGDLAQIMREIQQLGGSVHTVGAGGIGDKDALGAVTSVGLDPRKFYDYWRKIGRLAEERAEKERLAASLGVSSVEVDGEYLEIDVGVRDPILPLVASAAAAQVLEVTSAQAVATNIKDDEVSFQTVPTDDKDEDASVHAVGADNKDDEVPIQAVATKEKEKDDEVSVKVIVSDHKDDEVSVRSVTTKDKDDEVSIHVVATDYKDDEVSVQPVAINGKEDEASVQAIVPDHDDDEVSVEPAAAETTVADPALAAAAAKKAKRARQRAKQRAKGKARRRQAKKDDGRRTPIGVLGNPPKHSTNNTPSDPAILDASDADKENISPNNVPETLSPKSSTYYVISGPAM